MTLVKGDLWSVSFSSAVRNLLLYVAVWGDNSIATYTFDAPFTFRSGLQGATAFGDTLSVPGSGFDGDGVAYGIIEFTGPLSSLSLLATTVSDHGSGAGEVLTLAYDDIPASAPEPGTVWLLAASATGFFGFARRRSAGSAPLAKPFRPQPA